MVRVVVKKSRLMIADELARALGAEPWEREHFRRLRTDTLLRLITAAKPGWRDSVTVDT